MMVLCVNATKHGMHPMTQSHPYQDLIFEQVAEYFPAMRTIVGAHPP